MKLPFAIAAALVLGFLTPGTLRAGALDTAQASVVRIVFVAKDLDEGPTAEFKFFHQAGFVAANGDLIATKGWDPKALEAMHRQIEIYVAKVEPGGVRMLPAQAVNVDRNANLALVRAQNLGLPPLKLNLANVRVGDTIYAAEFPSHTSGIYSHDEWVQVLAVLQKWVADQRPAVISSPTVPFLHFVKASRSTGKVLHVTRNHIMKDGSELSLIEHDITVAYNGGAPLLNSAGQVVGLHSGQTEFPCCSQAILPLNDLLNQGNYGHLSGTMRPTSNWLYVSVALGAVLIGVAAVLIRQNSLQPVGIPPTMPDFHQQPPPPPPVPSQPPRGSMTNWLKQKSGRESGGTVAPTQVVRDRKRGGGGGGRYELRPVDGAGQPLALEEGQFRQQNGRLILGRSTALAHILVDGRDISNRHAAIRLKESRLYIEDLESSNGTRVNGKKLPPFSDTKISVGDTIALGAVKFRLGQV